MLVFNMYSSNQRTQRNTNMDNQDSYLDYVKTLTASEIRIEIKEVVAEYHEGDHHMKAQCREDFIVLTNALEDRG